MSYDNSGRRGEYGDDSSGYRRPGGEADQYFSESSRPSDSYGGRNEDSAGYQNQFGGQGGGQNYGDNQSSGGGYGASGGAHGGYDQDEAINQAKIHGNEEDGGLFSHAMSFLNKKKDDDDDDIDEQQMVGAHQQVYGDQSTSRPHDTNALGAGAAMQALKMFTGGGAGAGGMGSHGGGNSQSQFIGLAMAQAGKLFDQQQGQGNVASGADKQSAVNTAAKMALKLYMKSEGQGGGGGPGGLMGLAGKFM